MVWEKRVVLVRGTPASGKSILAALLHDYYERRKIPTALVRVWPENKPAYTVLYEATLDAGYDEEAVLAGLVFIIDGGQSTYFDQEFWLDVVKAQASGGTGPRLCIFSSYGNPTTGIPNYPPGSPPAVIPPEQRVALHRSNIPGSPCISLCFSRAELKNVIRRLTAPLNKALPLTEKAREYILELTQGHPGAVRGVIDLLQFVAPVPALSCPILPCTLTHGKALLSPD